MESAQAIFGREISAAHTADAAWTALRRLSAGVAGHRLFTVMTVDLAAGLAQRAFTSHPEEYPVSGTKPIQRNAWFDIVHGERRSFIANTIEDIAQVFPDHELIASLGCGSVLNLPVVLQGELAGTVNLLHEPHWYTPERVARAEAELVIPARLCFALAQLIDTKQALAGRA